MSPLDGIDTAQQHRQPRLTLVIITTHGETCDHCGWPLIVGTEAARWLGRTRVHIGCAIDPGAPKGGL